jgi:hypothetical protein
MSARLAGFKRGLQRRIDPARAERLHVEIGGGEVAAGALKVQWSRC